MTDRQQLMDELLQEFLESIDGLVIVEGRKDASALRALGVSNIVQLKGKHSMLDVVEDLQGQSVALLTDLDQEGKILRRKLLSLMRLYGMQENKKPREILARMRVSHVEGLASFYNPFEENARNVG
jgi:5S rRNA maturation endonuclease (ribonuclease M5)